MQALASASCFARKPSQLLRSGFVMNPAQVPGRLKKIVVIKAVWI
jgi:hypothetical protein